MILPYRQRKSPRLQGYDYAQAGSYFVTICTHNRIPLFGAIDDSVMLLNEVGVVAAQRWEAIPEHHTTIELDLFVVMPNHIHGIVILTWTVSTLDEAEPVPMATLGVVIGSYKSGVTQRLRQMGLITDHKVWQDRYHDHIIRSETDLHRIRAYVELNPARWTEDKFYQ